MEAEQFLARARADSTVQELERYTQEAQDRGVFGSPFYLFGDEIYWGQDRLQFLEEALARATSPGVLPRLIPSTQ
jgi:2-hydroxychromene-2-carboxylate isomerase